MHTYIYPVLTYCKKCTPIPAPAFAGILSKLCTPICTQTPPALCRQPSRFERLCPDFVASIGAHFFCLFFFVFFRRFVCCYMYTYFERRHLLRYTLFISSGLLYVYIFYIFFCIQTPPQGYYMYTHFERLFAAASQVKVYIFSFSFLPFVLYIPAHTPHRARQSPVFAFLCLSFCSFGILCAGIFLTAVWPF